MLGPGQTAIIPKGVPHKFYNPNDELVRFRVTLEPGHAGMENFIKILYGLAEDGLTDKKSIPKSFAHLASILVMADTNGTGMMSLMSPFIHMVARKAKRNGTEKWLLERYCK